MLDYVDAALFSKSNKFQGFVILSKYPLHTCGDISITVIHFVALLHMSLQISCVKVRFHPFIIIYATDIGSLAVFKDHFCCKK
jgi:hypothetical protein